MWYFYIVSVLLSLRTQSLEKVVYNYIQGEKNTFQNCLEIHFRAHMQLYTTSMSLFSPDATLTLHTT